MNSIVNCRSSKSAGTPWREELLKAFWRGLLVGRRRRGPGTVALRVGYRSALRRMQKSILDFSSLHHFWRARSAAGIFGGVKKDRRSDNFETILRRGQGILS